MTNSVEPDQTPRSAATDLGLHCLSGLSVCPITTVYYGSSQRAYNVEMMSYQRRCYYVDVCASIMMPSDILDYWSHQISAKSMKSLWTGDKRTYTINEQ